MVFVSLYSLQRSWTMQGLRVIEDMTSCSLHRCLYLADSGCDGVHRLRPESDGECTMWPLLDTPTSLSVCRNSGCETAPHSAGKSAWKRIICRPPPDTVIPGQKAPE